MLRRARAHRAVPADARHLPVRRHRKRRPTVKFIDRHLRKDGKEALFEITAARLSLNGGGEPRTLVIEAIRDLTEQVRYSQEQRLAEIGQLATGVAHEIYNPLASVRLGLQFIMKRHPDGAGVDTDTYSYLRVVDGAVDRCIEITKRLLNLSQLPSQSTQLVSLSVIVPEVISLLRYEAEQIGVGITLDLGESDLRVIATDSDMRMLILNLAQNAFHAMPSGGSFLLRGRIEDGRVLIEAGTRAAASAQPRCLAFSTPSSQSGRTASRAPAWG